MLLKKHIDILNVVIKILYFDKLTPKIVKKKIINVLVEFLIIESKVNKGLLKIKVKNKNKILIIKAWIIPCLFTFIPKNKEITQA